ncbi:SDR family oxidoreductase, partial [Myxococcota bacterium]|nr:SDR family oxidoreductase [Myxococcota bacterium]
TIIPLAVDVSSPEALKEALKNIESVDIIIASAGVCAQGRLDEAGADDVYRRTMATNVDGVWYLFRALHDKITPNGRAVIVSSGLGKLGRHGYGAYTASKHAVLGLTKCFAKELAPRQITVNAVCPGWVDTKMARADLVHTATVNGTTPEQERQAAEEAITLKRFVTAKEVAHLIVFLSSPEAGAITGQAYNISAGEFFA